jgi:hypothetical protein
MTVLDETAPSMAWATEWKNREGFEELLVERLTGATVSR